MERLSSETSKNELMGSPAVGGKFDLRDSGTDVGGMQKGPWVSQGRRRTVQS